jgi:hypothetical protein
MQRNLPSYLCTDLRHLRRCMRAHCGRRKYLQYLRRKRNLPNLRCLPDRQYPLWSKHLPQHLHRRRSHLQDLSRPAHLRWYLLRDLRQPKHLRRGIHVLPHLRSTDHLRRYLRRLEHLQRHLRGTVHLYPNLRRSIDVLYDLRSTEHLRYYLRRQHYMRSNLQQLPLTRLDNNADAIRTE